MPGNEISGVTALVTGASRGLRPCHRYLLTATGLRPLIATPCLIATPA